MLGCCRMDPKQDHTRLFERNPALQRDLPEVLVEGQQDARLGFGDVQQIRILQAAAIGPGPHYVMASGAKGVDEGFREVLVSEESHLRRDRVGFVFVGQIAGIGQAGENVFVRQAWIILQKIRLGLPRREELKDELDGQTRPANHWFAGNDLGINDDALGPRHDPILP